MFIKFNKVVAHNFLSLGHVEFSLNDNGLVLVEGHNNNTSDLASSNGSGKSSLFNAICWCLTGETIQGVSNNIVNIYSDGNCYVSLEFDLGKDTFKVTRQKSANKNDLKVVKNDQDISGKGIRESSKILENELGDLTSDLIGSIIVLGQGLPHKFSNNTPAGRKELLEKLSKSDFMIEDIKNRLSARRDALNEEIKGNKDIVISEKAKLGIYEGYIADSQEKLNSLKDIDFSNIETMKDLVEIKSEAKNNIENNIKEIDDNISQHTTSLATLSINKDTAINDLTAKFNLAVEPITSEQKELDTALNNIQFKLDHADDDICPTCGQKIPDKEHIDKQPLLDEQAELNEKWNCLEDRKSELKQKFESDKKSILTEFDATNITSTISELNNNKLDLTNKVRILTTDISNLTNKIATIRAESEAYQKNMEQLQQTIDLNLARKQQAEDKIVYYTEEAEELSQHLDVVNQMLTIVKRDFRGYLLTNVIDFINSKANDYSNVVFGTRSIRFELDGNNINILYCNKPYENLSGGEKQKVDLIIQFALKDMLSSYLNVYCNILVLDEIFDNLDTVGCERVFTLISDVSDVSSVYIISHHADELQIPYDSKIIIEKDSSGISSLVNAV